MSDSNIKSNSAYPHGGIAIIGGGIAGLTLGIGLLHRQIPCTIYEQARSFKEIGAGVAFTPNSIRAMKACAPGIHAAFETVATHNSWESKQANPAEGRQGVWFDFVDGYHQGKGEAQGTGTGEEKFLFTVLNDQGSNSVHRAHFLDEMVKLVPEGVAKFRKHIESIDGDDGDATGPLTLHFTDGTTATADAVVGADGIKSRVRQLILGEDSPESHAHYSHKYAYRGLIPMEQAIEALGEDMASNSHMHLGPDRHVLTFPIDGGKTMNVVAFTTTTEPWPNTQKLTMPATRADALKDFAGWGHTVTTILEMLQDDLDIWAIFDMLDNPASTFAKGRLCITGDAAHATTPHHGSGAGFAIEDSAVMAELLASPGANTPAGLRAAFQVFDESRRERTQWLVASSRRSGQMYEWQTEYGDDYKKIEAELKERSAKIWDGDIYQMAKDAQEKLRVALEK